MRVHQSLVMGTLVLLIGGCAAPQIEMTYDSVPQGATVSERGVVLGETPLTVTYPVEKAAVKSGQCIKLLPISVRWASGAKAPSKQTVCLRGEMSRHATIRRPADHPGESEDALYALELQRNRLLAAQAEAQRDANQLMLYQAFQDGFDRERARQAQTAPPRSTVNCTSQQIGNQTYTNCH